MFIKELMKKGITKGAQKLSGQGKTTGKEGIKFIKPGTSLTTKRNIQDKTVKAVEEGTKKGMQKSGAKSEFLTAEQKRALRQSVSKSNREESKKLKGISDEYDRLEKKLTKAKADMKKRKKIKTAAGATAVGAGTAAAGLTVKKIKDKRQKKMGGGMMGRRMGYSQGKLAVTPREKQLAAQYGDKKRITRGDVITAAKSKSGKRMQASVGGGADMTKVASDKTKKKAKKFEKRAKAASKDIKNIGRSFSSIQREKYMR